MDDAPLCREAMSTCSRDEPEGTSPGCSVTVYSFQSQTPKGTPKGGLRGHCLPNGVILWGWVSLARDTIVCGSVQRTVS